MNISTATIGADTETEVEVREYGNRIEVRMLTPHTGIDSRPVIVYVNGQEISA